MAPSPLLPIDEAIARMGAHLRPLASERVPLADADGRVLAAPVSTQLTQPPADMSAMDGYAVRHSDLLAQRPLRLIGTSRAGEPSDLAVEPGTCIRIFTGAYVPAGADTVLIQEDAEVDGDLVLATEIPPAGRHIRKAGLDFRKGDSVLQPPVRLGPAQVALLAAMNIPEVDIHRRPRVAFFASGDELVHLGETPGKGQIVSSNSVALAALIRRAGGIPVDLGIARDTEQSIQETAAAGRGCDLMISLGGASVGEHDLIQPALRARGLEVDFWRLAIRPGKPLMFGSFGGIPFIGLPGNPVSALVCATLLVEPAIGALQGLPMRHPELVMIASAVDLKANDHRQDYLRARFDRDAEGRMLVHPFDAQDSSMLSVLAQADGLLVRPPHAPAVPRGTLVPVLRFLAG